MKYAILILGLAGMVGLTGGLGYTALRGNPTMPVLGKSLPLSIRNYSASYTSGSSSSSRRSGGYYYGSSRRHSGGGYRYGK